MKNLVRVGVLASVFILSACGQSGQSDSQADQDAQANAGDKKVVVFSARKQHLIDPLFQAFTAETGIKVEYITDNAQPMISRILASKSKPEADIFMAVDAGSLWSAAQQGVLAPVQSEVLESKVPASLRDENGLWFGLSQRARTIVYSTERVQPSELSTYEQLADSNWQGRLCLRTSQKVYNQSLIGMLIEHNGEAKVTDMVKKWVANLAVPVFSSDTLLVQAIASGQCDVGVVNTYYVGQELAKDKDLPVGVFWADQNSHGVHMNISGAGVVKNASNPKEAVQLLEWLVSSKAQEKFAGLNYEFPVVKDTPVDPLVAAWGAFKADNAPISKAGENQAKAIMLMDQAGYK